MQVFSLLIIDQHTFELVHCHTFMPFEYATSHPNHYYVVGTGIIQREESETKAGGVSGYMGSLRRSVDLRYCLCTINLFC